MAFRQPTYEEFMHNVSRVFLDEFRKLDGPRAVLNLWSDTLRLNYNSLDLLIVAILVVLWTLFRTCITAKFKAFAKFSGLAKRETAKAPECMWKLLISIIFWTSTATLVLGKYDLFTDPSNCVRGWHPDLIIPFDVYCVYALQVSFYVHSIYASLSLDEWRSDTPVLLTHHAVSILLLALSFLCKYFHLGLLVLFCHDLSDVFLEATKLAVYYKTKGGRWFTAGEIVSTAGFIMLAITWFVYRLYWFPLKAIYASTYIAVQLHPDLPPFSLFLNCLLMILLFMHVYWFTLILRIVYDVTTGKSREINDIRESDGNEVKSMQNGSNHALITKKKTKKL
uniref:Ceramide synthase 1-like n=1 Tax=Phallusia mammillata TaxID=59560 RepID=A0A6F9D9Q5_9ASCI|nr:ceramide synthase 1-like [Phallusia mammillata]